MDLLIGERTDLLAINTDGADQLVLSEQRHDQKGPGAAVFCDRFVRALHRHVGHLNRLFRIDEAIKETRCRTPLNERHFFTVSHKLGWRVMERDAAERIALTKQHGPERG